MSIGSTSQSIDAVLCSEQNVPRNAADTVALRSVPDMLGGLEIVLDQGAAKRF